MARIVKRIPRGTTLAYGEVALRAGKPGAARAVVSALRNLDGVPWWRVARHDGSLAPQVATLQSMLLAQEGWKRKKGKSKNTPQSRRGRREKIGVRSKHERPPEQGRPLPRHP